MKRFALLLALALVACDTADPATYTKCVRSHTEMHLTPKFGPSLGGVPIGNGMELRPTSVCDTYATFDCEGWVVEKGLFDSKYTRCTQYQQRGEVEK